MAKGKSLMQRTLAVLKERGALYQKTETYNVFAHKRQDLFGFIDVLAVYPDSCRLVGIQVCDSGSRLEHIEKIRNCESFRQWLTVGKIEVWSWSKKLQRNAEGKRTKKAVWELNVQEVKE